MVSMCALRMLWSAVSYVPRRGPNYVVQDRQNQKRKTDSDVPALTVEQRLSRMQASTRRLQAQTEKLYASRRKAQAEYEAAMSDYKKFGEEQRRRDRMARS